MDFEPVGAPTIPRPALGHADHEALAQSARLARGSVLLVDDALVVVFALRQRTDVVVSSSEERLQQKYNISVIKSLKFEKDGTRH